MQLFETDEIDQLSGWDYPGWEFEYFQLKPGKLGFRYLGLELPDLLVEWQEFGNSVFGRESMNVDQLTLGTVVSADGLPKICGGSVRVSHVLVYQPGRPCEFVIPDNATTLNVTIKGKSFRQLNWIHNHESLVDIGPQSHSRLVQACREITDQMRRANPAGCFAWRRLANQTLIQIVQSEVLSKLNKPVYADGATNVAKAYRVFKQAETLLNSQNNFDRTTIKYVAQDLGVSERTIFNAFKESLGISPGEFCKLQNLHRFRRSILKGKVFHGMISQAALSNGFQHFGRLTENYRRFFGETPRQTIKRRR